MVSLNRYVFRPPLVALSVTRNSLTLEYRTQPFGSGMQRPACDCKYELDVVFRAVEKKNWNAELRSPDLPEDVYRVRMRPAARP
jgi:hypothetical protein